MSLVNSLPLENCPFIVSLEEGSCTARAVQFFVDHAFEHERTPPPIFFEKSFPAAVNRVTSTVNAAMFVPSLHELTVILPERPDFRPLRGTTFSLHNPPLYLARTGSFHKLTPDVSGKCALLKTLEYILGDHALDLVYVNSTQEAARLARVGKVEFAITNAAGAAQNKLIVVDQLPQIYMTWRCFQYIGGNATTITV